MAQETVTDQVQEKVLGTQVAQVTERTIQRFKGGAWWCPFCDRSMLLKDARTCSGCGAVYGEESGFIDGVRRFAVKTVIVTRGEAAESPKGDGAVAHEGEAAAKGEPTRTAGGRFTGRQR